MSTLELDTHVTKDEKVVVNHDRQISAQKCRDTAPVTPGDPLYPCVGKYIKDLTLAQIKTLDCGYQQLPGFPEQEVIHGHPCEFLPSALVAPTVTCSTSGRPLISYRSSPASRASR